MGSALSQATKHVANKPSTDLANTTCPGSLSATPRDKVLSMPQATVAAITASKPMS